LKKEWKKTKKEQKKKTKKQSEWKKTVDFL